MEDYSQLPEVQIVWIGPENLELFQLYIPAELIHVGGALGIVDEMGMACGALVFELEDACCRILSLFIAPQSRRQHLATTLFATLVDGVDMNPEWGLQSIQVSFSATAENGLEQFFRSVQFELMQQEEETYCLQVANLIDSGFTLAKAPAPQGMEVVTVESLLPVQLKQLTALLHQRGTLYIEEGITQDTVVGNLSFVALVSGEIKACSCVTREEDGYYLSQVYGDPDSKSALVQVLEQTAQALKTLPRETMIYIPLVAESAARLAQYVVKYTNVQRQHTYDGIFLL